jgi:hypothetical protein
VVQRREKLRLPLEAGEMLGVVSEPIGKDLDGDVTPELGVTGSIDLAHAARSDRRDDLVLVELAPGSQRHALFLAGNDSFFNTSGDTCHRSREVRLDPRYSIARIWISPEGRFVGFGAGGELKKIDLERGTVAMLADARSLRGGLG